jgi:glutaminase
MSITPQDIELILQDAYQTSLTNKDGEPAQYIPELAKVDPDVTAAAIWHKEGWCYSVGDSQRRSTLQSVAKVVLLTGLIEEYGVDQVFKWIGTEPSGLSFSSLTQLDTYGPRPANPLVNAGAIALCSRIPGDEEAQNEWLYHWMTELIGSHVRINETVRRSEADTAHRNRALAHLMKSSDILKGDVDRALLLYFTLCAYEDTVEHIARLPLILANGGRDERGIQVLNPDTVKSVIAIMTTSGLYNESGSHLLRTGLPAKSGVSGLIIASAIGHAGIAVFNPRINDKGGSIRGHLMLEEISKRTGWHFGLPE